MNIDPYTLILNGYTVPKMHGFMKMYVGNEYRHMQSDFRELFCTMSLKGMVS